MNNNKWQHQKEKYKKENNPNYRGGKNVSCAQCGKSIYRRPWELKRSKNHFCSTTCHDDFRRFPEKPEREMRGKSHPRWAGEKFCKICGKKLIERRARQKLICSNECSKVSKILGNEKGKIKQYGKGGGRTIYQCEHCGKSVETTSSTAKRRKFCSQECHVLSGTNLKNKGQTKLELAVEKAIKELGYNYLLEYSPSGAPGRYDFYLPELNTLIEADGEFWHYSEWANEKFNVRERDARKTKWAKDNGYKLIRLKEFDVLEYGAINLLKEKI